MVDAIIYQGPPQTGGAVLKDNELKTPGLSGLGVSRSSFNDVYSNVIENERAETAGDVSAPAGKAAVVTAFLDYMKKTPEELYFERILDEKGLTQEQFDMLPQKEKAMLFREIMEEVKLRMEEDAAKKAAGKQV